MTEIDWRRVLGALSNADARTLFAQLVLGTPAEQTGAEMKPGKRAAALKALRMAGLLVPGAQGEVLDPGAFRRALESGAPKERAVGVERFLRDGRIDRYPAKAGELGELLTWVAQRVLDGPEELTEAQVNERLSDYTDDVARLRRALVDHRFMGRAADGSAYRRT